MHQILKEEKIRALIEYEIKWAIENAKAEQAKEISSYIFALFDSLTDKAIDKLYQDKIVLQD